MAVAEATGGEYYLAENAEQLNEVFAELPTDLIVAPRGRRDQRRVHGGRGGPDRPRDPARAGLAAVAVGDS